MNELMKDSHEADRELLVWLARRRVFTTADLAATAACDRRQAVLTAGRLAGLGFLRRVQRGVYAVVPLEARPDGFQPDPVLAVSAALGKQYAFSHFSALMLHGVSHQEHRTVHISAPGVRSRRLNVGTIPVHVHNVERKNWDSATSRVKRGGQELLVTTVERTLMDLLSLPADKQDYDELVNVFRSLLQRSDHPKLAVEASTWGTKAAQARLGHLLLHYGKTGGDKGIPFDGRTGDLATLKSPTYFGTRPRNPANRLDRVFNVIYPKVA